MTEYDAYRTSAVAQMAPAVGGRTLYMPSLSGTSFDGASFEDSTSSFSATISGYQALVQNWALGQTFSVQLDSLVAGQNSIHGTDFSEIAGGSVVLTAISDTNPSPTPIPGAAWLLGSGLVGVYGFMRKKKAA